MTPQEFNARYWGAQPLPVQALSGMETESNERIAKAWKLAGQGYSIDADIMLRGGDPYWVQWMRLQNGYTWVYALGTQPTNLVLAPHLSFPGMAPYDPLKPPAGALKVSLDLADYPIPEVPQNPTEPVEAVPVSPFWARRTGNFCEAHPLDRSEDGSEYNGPEGKWRKTVVPSAFGTRQYWMKVA